MLMIVPVCCQKQTSYLQKGFTISRTQWAHNITSIPCSIFQHRPTKHISMIHILRKHCSLPIGVNKCQTMPLHSTHGARVIKLEANFYFSKSWSHIVKQISSVRWSTARNDILDICYYMDQCTVQDGSLSMYKTCRSFQENAHLKALAYDHPRTVFPK